MDWYAWLSKTNLESPLVYDYGLTFARNELHHDDLPYFNHDFLQSIGISVAKHRLEILKLCRADVRGKASNGLSRLVLVMNKTRKLFARNIGKLGFPKNPTRFSPAEMSPYRNKSIGGNVMWSGPLDPRLQQKLTVATRCQSVSGPLDAKMRDRLVYPPRSPMAARRNERSGLVCRSPTISGPVDRLGLSPKVGYYRSELVGDDHNGVQRESLWSIMFQDMKPT